VASHDFFGPGSSNNRTVVFGSADRGMTWVRRCELEGQWWSTLFVHRDALYILGTTKEYGNAVIRRSLDGGKTWTTPTHAGTGLLRDDGQYHCAPTPVLEHQGRLWRGMERRDPPLGWGVNFRAGMMSAPADADLLDAKNWNWSNFLQSDTQWLGGSFGAWLEGNAVATRNGHLVDVLRVDTTGYPEKAALVAISHEGRTASFAPNEGFIDFPGGAKKFSIRFDAQSDLYWSLATVVPDQIQTRTAGQKPASIRNTLALTCSPDLTNWTLRCLLLHHPDTAAHGFQYVDWLFDGDDLIAACRTACDDGLGGAHNFHDANYLTFHRITAFRSKTMSESVPMVMLRSQTRDFLVTGHGWSLQPLADGAKAFSNRDYVWKGVPARFQGWRYTQTGGGERADILVQAQRATTLYCATTLAQAKVVLAGWTPVENAEFNYTDRGQTRMRVFSRAVQAGEETRLPQGNWTGGVLLLPAEPRSGRD